jgi:hypothetical protein
VENMIVNVLNNIIGKNLHDYLLHMIRLCRGC